MTADDKTSDVQCVLNRGQLIEDIYNCYCFRKSRFSLARATKDIQIMLIINMFERVHLTVTLSVNTAIPVSPSGAQ